MSSVDMISTKSTIVVFTIMIVSAVVIISFAILLFKYHKKRKARNFENVSDLENDDSSVWNQDEEESELLPPSSDDTLTHYQKQVSARSLSNLSNVRYIEIATVNQDFTLPDAQMKANFKVSDVINFGDIAIGFVDCLSDVKIDENTKLTHRASAIYKYIEHLRIENIHEMSQINEIIVYICKLVIKQRYNKKDSNNVTMRDTEEQEFKSDVFPIVEWIWKEKMNETPRHSFLFAQDMSQWISECVY